ncbi:CDP-archaeol synthase [Candidatus Falkowbacteria bacterium]|jgi:hypothetical protein|nr:CDP-archaeol synthase [Candidatus Falkowbacteria bacterium]
MMKLTFANFIFYMAITWGCNISLNFLYVLKKFFPVVLKYDYPLDFRKKLGAHRILGESTTWLGLSLSVFLSLLFYILLPWPWFLVPFTVYFGHSLGSFIKRCLGKKDGSFLLLVDHGDYMLLTGIIFYLSGQVSISLAISTILATYLLHPLACFIAFKLGLKKYPY